MSKKHVIFIKPVLQGCAVLLFAVLLGIWAGTNPAVPASAPETETETSGETTSETQPVSGSEKGAGGPGAGDLANQSDSGADADSLSHESESDDDYDLLANESESDDDYFLDSEFESDDYNSLDSESESNDYNSLASESESDDYDSLANEPESDDYNSLDSGSESDDFDSLDSESESDDYNSLDSEPESDDFDPLDSEPESDDYDSLDSEPESDDYPLDSEPESDADSDFSTEESGAGDELSSGEWGTGSQYVKSTVKSTDSGNPLLPYSQYKISDDNADWFVTPTDFIESYISKYKILTSDTPDTIMEYTDSPLSWGDLEKLLTFMTGSYDGVWSIYVKDLKNDRAININEQYMEAASLIKLYIMGTLYDELGINAIDENAAISDALYNMITISDNESANILVRALDPEGDHSKGLVKVNDFIRKYGFTNTEQVNGLADPSLWSADGRLNRTSAKDCGLFLEYVYRGEIVSHLASRDMETLLLGQEIDYKIPDSLPPGVVSASKTGEIEGSENDTAIVYSPGGDYIISIMSKDWSDDSTAISRIHSLSQAVYAYFNPDSGYTVSNFLNVGGEAFE